MFDMRTECQTSDNPVDKKEWFVAVSSNYRFGEKKGGDKRQMASRSLVKKSHLISR